MEISFDSVKDAVSDVLGTTSGKVAAGAAGAAVVGGVVAASVYAARKRKSKKRKVSRSKRSRSRSSKSRRKKGNYRPYTAGKRPDTSRRRIRYTKKGQPYVIVYRNIDGTRRKMAKFIKKSSAKRSRKLKGGKY